MTTQNAQIQLRRDTAANWTSEDPILASGEVGIETDTSKIKIGDGTTAWTSLAYFGGGSGSPGGADTGVQFNDSGAFGGEDSFTFDKATHAIVLGNGTHGAVISFNTGSGEAGIINNISGLALQFLGGADGEGTIEFYGTPIFFGGSASFDTVLSGNKAVIDTALLSAERNFSYPDQSGTIALLSDVPGASTPPLFIDNTDSPYTVLATDGTILCDASGGAMTDVLPPATGSGKVYNIKKIDNSANTVTVDGDGSETIDGAANYVLTVQYESITVQDCVAGVWLII